MTKYNDNSVLFEAARSGKALYFEPWEENPGIIEMRRIHVETKQNTGGRMQRSQKAFVSIKMLWEAIDAGMNNSFLNAFIKLFIPEKSRQTIDATSKSLNTIFARMQNDKNYATLAYNTFPILADRYGAGKQANGKPRLSLSAMIDDPIARELTK